MRQVDKMEETMPLLTHLKGFFTPDSPGAEGANSNVNVTTTVTNHAALRYASISRSLLPYE
jgi:hypothetical protein